VTLRLFAFAMTLVYIRYADHVLFRDSDASLYHLSLRECVGWIFEETPEYVVILCDRSVERLPNQVRESGLVISRKDIIEMKILG